MTREGEQHAGPGRPPTHLDEDTCLDLVHGLLRPDEEEPWLDHVRSCGRCEALLRETAGERERLRVSARLRTQGEDAGVDCGARSSADALTPPGARKPLRSRRASVPRLGLGALAAAAAVTVLWFVAPSRGPEWRLSDRLRWLPDAGDMRVTRDPGSASTSAELVAGLESYAMRDVGAAIRHLEAARAAGPMESLRRAYLGSSLAWAGRAKEAAAVLGGLTAESLPEPWRSESRWTLALAWRTSGSAKAADSLLAVLAAEPGAMGERARGLLGSE